MVPNVKHPRIHGRTYNLWACARRHRCTYTGKLYTCKVRRRRPGSIGGLMRPHEYSQPETFIFVKYAIQTRIYKALVKLELRDHLYRYLLSCSPAPKAAAQRADVPIAQQRKRGTETGYKLKKGRYGAAFGSVFLTLVHSFSVGRSPDSAPSFASVFSSPLPAQGNSIAPSPPRFAFFASCRHFQASSFWFSRMVLREPLKGIMELPRLAVRSCRL
ncbi:hypothetical protein H6P81_001199 [Aristolochia fimbriata]|uniref:Uncharacterized protein n=1 Tax=Aristolochia fimbriata TaxID=158543 RepID=A0AAV7FA30_ARIFI|nr:hypothetical protein H6P81_001199 [Aristolochia fimbriata]